MANDAFDVDVVHNLAHIGHHLPGKLQFAEAERPAAPLAAGPAEVKADHLPQRVEPEATGHHGVALEMATEEPEVPLDVEFGANKTLAVFPAGLGNVADAVEHQNRGKRKLWCARR